MTQPREAGNQVDPVTASVIHGALEGIAVEMGYKLMRMSYSSIIRESEDFGAALVDAQGRGLAESAQSTPLQSGPIPGYVRGVLAQTASIQRVATAGGVAPSEPCNAANANQFARVPYTATYYFYKAR